MILTPEQSAHVRVMRAVLAAMQDSPLVLKGGTALLLCYGLDRFSEDLDFDAPKKLNLESRLERALSQAASQSTISRTKDTDTVQRYRVIDTVPECEGRLKIEVSCRDAIAESSIVERDGIRTYPVGLLAAQKARAFKGRTAARDLFDLNFIARRFPRELDPDTVARLLALTSDLDAVEARFRPAFEDDDLFRGRVEDLASLLLEMRESLGRK